MGIYWVDELGTCHLFRSCPKRYPINLQWGSCWLFWVLVGYFEQKILHCNTHQIWKFYIVIPIKCPSVRTSVNNLSLSHLLRDHWSDCFETCLGCSPDGLVCKPKIGSCPSTNMVAIGHIGFSPLSHLLRNQRRTFDETLHMNSFQPLGAPHLKRFRSVN